MRIADELARQLGQLRVALRQCGQMRQRLADVLGGGLRGPPAREQSQSAAVGGVDQLGDLVEVRLGQPDPARRGQVLGHVEDRLLAVVERRPHVEALPGAVRSVVVLRRIRPGDAGAQPERGGDRVEVAAELERGGGEDGRLLGEQLLPHRPGDLERGDTEEEVAAAVAVGAPLRDPEDVLLRARCHPLGCLEQVLGPALRLRRGGVPLARARRRLLREGRDEGAGSVADQGQRVGELLGHVVDPAGLLGGDGVAQRVPGIPEVVGLGALDVALRPS